MATLPATDRLVSLTQALVRVPSETGEEHGPATISYELLRQGAIRRCLSISTSGPDRAEKDDRRGFNFRFIKRGPGP